MNSININNRANWLKSDGFLIILVGLISIVFVFLLSNSTSPLWYIYEGYDSCVFKTIGLALLQGKIPYVDVVDHKGPVLYFINAFGLWIGGGKTGIFLLQIIANTISFVFIYKLIRIFLNVFQSIIAFIGVILLYAYFYQGGNLCEEWMLCFISPALYMAIRNILSQQNLKRLLVDSAFYGFCFAMCFLIRPNDAVIHIGGLMLGTCLWMIVNRQYLQAWQNALVMGLSFIVCASPIVLFFAVHNALPDLWYGLITYNAKYAGGGGLFSSILSINKLLIFVPLLFTVIFLSIRKQNALLFVFIPLILLAWLFVGARMYRHYWICMLPLLSMFGVAGFYWKKVSVSVAILGLSAFGLLCTFKSNVVSSAFAEIKEKAQTYVYKHTIDLVDFYAESEKLFSYVPVEEQNQIWNYNLVSDAQLYFSVFFHHGVVQCNRILLYPMVFIDEELRNSDDVKKANPMWIMLSKESCWLVDDWQKQDYEYIRDHYECVAATNPEICEIEMWKRK